MYTLTQIALILGVIFIVINILWFVGQFIGWISDEIALWRLRRRENKSNRRKR